MSPVLCPPWPLNAAFLHCLRKSTSSSTISLINKTPNNFGLGIFLPLPPVLSCLASSESSAGLGAARAHKAPSVGTSGATHTDGAVCLLQGPTADFL